MALTRLAIQRPIAIGMLILGMILVGVVAHQKLNVQLLPNLDQAAVTVVTTYPGASAEDVEQLVTKQVEDTIATPREHRLHTVDLAGRLFAGRGGVPGRRQPRLGARGRQLQGQRGP